MVLRDDEQRYVAMCRQDALDVGLDPAFYYRLARLSHFGDGTFVYFIRCPVGPIKIGMSIEPLHRLKQLQTASPWKLTMLGVIRGESKDEKALHHELRMYRMHGEWFDGCKEVVDHVTEVIRKNPITEWKHG